MKKTDISRYTDNKGPQSAELPAQGGSAVKKALKVTWKAIATILLIGVVTGCIVFVSVLIYIFGMSDNTVDFDLRKQKLNLTSFIYVNDEEGNPKEYQRVYDVENRVWVDFQDIPQAMKDAMVAIEDKRFYSHHGVDWKRTFSAVFTLFTGQDGHGGSTITQQLIKNITEHNEVSLTRKITEIFSALNFEKEYSKDEILEAYLNVVNFGSGCNGVQAAANLYFDKDIKDCSIAECAAIAGITQNPAAYNPLIYPEKNKERQQTVLGEMYNQEKISKEEYDEAMKESEHMKFVGYQDEEEDEKTPTQSWYIDAMLTDIANDLAEKYNISEKNAFNMLYHQGLKIYCAMDLNAQEAAEAALHDEYALPQNNQKLQLGYLMMGYDGRVLATIGSRLEKDGSFLFDRANSAKRQTGSVIKPIAVYGPAIDLGLYNYSSILLDEPLDNVDVEGDGNLKKWPVNANGKFVGEVTLQYALQWSLNTTAARLVDQMSPAFCCNFLIDKLGFTSLDPKRDATLSAMATGGMEVGVTVREMAAAFAIFGNGGKYYEPYTYFYVEDNDGNVILDNRNPTGSEAISSETSTIMRQLLYKVITSGTGYGAGIGNWQIFGKTGTTSDNKDSWFVGGSPYAVAAVWTGFDTPKALNGYTQYSSLFWRSVMSKYLDGKASLTFEDDKNVVSRTYCTETGLLASNNCTKTAVGYYAIGNIPTVCNADHRKDEETSSKTESAPSSSEGESVPPASNSETTREPESSSETESSIQTSSEPFNSSSEPQNDNTITGSEAA